MAARVLHALPPPLVLALLLSLAEPVAAQRVLISVAGPGLPPATDLVDIPTGRVRRLTTDVTDKAVFTADGAVLVRRVSGERRWRARLLSSGAEITLPEGFGAPTLTAAPVIVPHPRELVLFGLFSDSGGNQVPARLDIAGLRLFRACDPAASYSGLDLSPDGRLLFVLCPDVFNGPAQAVAVLDSRTGAELRRVLVPGAVALSLIVGPLATDFATVHLDVMAGQFTMTRRDAVSGAVLVSTGFPFPAAGNVQVELVANPRRRDRPVLVRCRDIGTSTVFYDCVSHVVDYMALTIGATVQATGKPPSLQFTAAGDDAIVGAERYAARVRLANGTTLAAVAAPARGFVIAAWGAEPGAPVQLTAAVTGNAVALSWTLPEASPAVTGYRLEVGSRAGATDILSTAIGAAPAYRAAAVPRGRYYVRIRGVNANGVGAPSGEVIVDVP